MCIHVFLKKTWTGRGRRGRRGERRVLNMAVIFCKLGPHVILNEFSTCSKNMTKQSTEISKLKIARP